MITMTTFRCPHCHRDFDRPFRYGSPTWDRHDGPVRTYDRCFGCLRSTVDPHATSHRLPYDHELAPFRVGQGTLFG